MDRREKIIVGETYEVGWAGKPNHLVFVVIGERVARTVRFKKEEPGWRVIILDCGTWSSEVPGSVHTWVKDASVFASAKRIS